LESTSLVVKPQAQDKPVASIKKERASKFLAQITGVSEFGGVPKSKEFGARDVVLFVWAKQNYDSSDGLRFR
jgi:hypothetical protein